jgi:hypothetical protein
LGIATEGVNYIRIVEIPGEVRSIEGALGYVHSSLLITNHIILKTVIMALPRYSKFPDIDGFILYHGNNSTVP